MPTGADDDVLDASGDKDLSLRATSAITAVEPTVADQFRGGLRIVEISTRRRWPAELESPFATLAELATAVIDDAHLMLSDRRAARWESQRVDGVRIRVRGDAVLHERFAIESRRSEAPRPVGGTLKPTAHSARP